jgi:hypothetical protein
LISHCNECCLTQVSDILLFSKSATVNNDNKLRFSPQTSGGAVLVHVEGEIYKPIAAPLLQSSTPPMNSAQSKDAQEKSSSPLPKQKIGIVHVKGHRPR